MNNKPFAQFTVADVAEPTVDAATLGQLAASRPDLWNAILAHPNCYPDLATWIHQQAATTAAPPHATQAAEHATPAAEHTTPAAAPTPEVWAAQFQAANGREPSMSEYQTAVANGEIAKERKPLDPSVGQMADGAKQIATGAKEFFTTKIAPTAAGAGRAVHQSISESADQMKTNKGWRAWVPIAVPSLAFIGFISIFLPMAIFSVSAMGYSDSRTLGFFDRETGGAGGWLVTLLLLVLAAGILAIVVRQPWARITAAVVGMVVGVLAIFVSFGTLISIYSNQFGSSIVNVSVLPGAGLVLLALVSLGILAASLITIIPHNRQSATP